MIKELAVCGCVALVGSFCFAKMSQAVEFAVVGAWAAGMGGAGVAVTSDAYATYWIRLV